jgi:hypothetical protein
MMKALYFRHHNLEQKDCTSIEEGRTLLTNISDDGQGWAVGVYDTEQKVLHLDGFDNIIGQNPADVESRVLRDLKAAGIVPDKLKSLN